jgi:serine/threonine protein kinase
VDYARHARAGSPFYEESDGDAPHSDSFSTVCPAGWRRHASADWVHVVGPAVLPVQGWKIHVSSTIHEARHVLAIVAREAVELGVSFKHLPDARALHEQSAKYADRGRSGKFITVYPATDDQFEALLVALGDRLDGIQGPYILSDVRWRHGPVYFRWGGFKPMEMVTESGDRVPAVLAPDGEPVPDARDAVFTLPEFVEVPALVRSAVRERLDPTDRGTEDLLGDRDIRRVLHFSNGGGVYLLGPGGDGEQQVMKEGRPGAGLDGQGRSARDRVEHEFAVLQRLRDIESVVSPSELRHVGDHAFMTEEYIDGTSLFDWVAAHYPYSHVDDIAVYERLALDLLDQLEDALRQVHARGVALMDLQPRNVLVDRGGRVRLIDLETACDTDERDVATIGTPGYVPPWPTTPRGRDLYSLAQTGMHIFQPLTPLNDLSDRLWESATATVTRDFGSRASGRLAELRVEALVEAPARGGELEPAGADIAGDEGRQRALADALRQGCQESRRASTNRIYPGDPRQFSNAGAWDIEHGLAGVMHVLGENDPHATTDRERLAEASEHVTDPGGGLLRGLLGIAVVLAARGAPEDAEQTAERALGSPPDPLDVSLRTGVSGRVLALRELSRTIPSSSLAAAYGTAVNDLRRLIRELPSGLHSPGRSTAKPIGLLDGWSGAAVAAVALGRDTGDHSWFDLARTALDADRLGLEEARDGSLQVRDGSRLMPYLADGSAGIGVALAQLPQRGPEDDDTLVRIARACRVRCCSNAGLMHGRAGLLAALTLLPVPEVDGSLKGEVLTEQASRLHVHLFRSRSGSGVVAAGENCLRLSTDFGTGSAGVAAALDLLRMGGQHLIPAVPLEDSRAMTRG